MVSLLLDANGLATLQARGFDMNCRSLGGGQYLAKAVVSKAAIPTVYYTSGVLSMAVKPEPFISDLVPKDPEAANAQLDMPRVRQIIQADQANALGYTGAGVHIAIVDTGVDYAVPDLSGALDYVSGSGWREPLALDADETQVLTFVTLAAVNGTLPSDNVTVVTYTPFKTSIKISGNATVAGVPSASGNYKIGMTYEDVTVALVKHAVLLTDPISPGNYTRVYVDFQDSLNFTAAPFYEYDGDRITHFDDASGLPVDTVGVAGAFFYDQFMWFTFPAQFLRGWSLSGEYLSFFYDFEGHGTQTSGSAAARGVLDYDIPGYSSIFGVTKLTGIAPDAKIVGVKGLYWGNVEPGMLWAAGFNVDSQGNYYWSGAKRADVISNSWGISTMTYDVAAFGYDFESMILNGIVTPGFLDPNYPGTLVVNAAGNGGYGYSTVTSPGTASGALTVAASTNMLFRSPPENASLQADQIISWSARAPTPAGEIKPEVANVGAFGYTVARVYDGLYSTFGGTSMSTPLTAGVAALVFQAAYGSASIANPFNVKMIIQNTVDDLGNEPFQQGAGRVNALKAVTAALRLAGSPQTAAPTPQLSFSTSYSALSGIYADSFELQWDDLIQNYFYLFFASVIPHQATNLGSYWNGQGSGIGYGGRVTAGYATSFLLNIKNTDSAPVTTTITPYTYVKLLDTTSTITMTASSSGPSFYLYYDPSQFQGVDLTRFSVSVPFSSFDPSGSYSNEFFYYLYVYDWLDANHDGIVQTSERNLIDYSYQSGTHLEVYVANLAKDVPSGHQVMIRIRAFGPAVPVTFQYSMVNYKRAIDPSIFVNPRTYPISAGSTLPVTVVVTTSPTDLPGPREGFLLVRTTGSGGTSVQMVPFSYVITNRVSTTFQTITPTPSGDAAMYDLGVVRGSFDWAWRAESGDWRVYTVFLDDPTTFALEVDFTWQDNNSSLAAFVVGPDGEFTSYSLINYMGSGVFGWYGTGSASAPQNKVVLFAPADYTYGSLSSLKRANRAGYFTIMIHEVLHGGNYLNEQVVGTVRALRAPLRLPSTLSVHAGASVPLSTSIRVPYSLIAAGSTPSVEVVGTTSSPSLVISPASYNYTSGFTPNAGVFTSSIPLMLDVSTDASLGTYVAVVLFYANIPDLTVWQRTAAGYEVVSSLYPFVDSVLVTVT